MGALADEKASVKGTKNLGTNSVGTSSIVNIHNEIREYQYQR
jgi:hypothetical protein